MSFLQLNLTEWSFNIPSSLDTMIILYKTDTNIHIDFGSDLSMLLRFAENLFH